MGHNHIRHPISDSIRASDFLVLSLDTNISTPDTPLATYPQISIWHWVNWTEITSGIRFSTKGIEPELVFYLENIISCAIHNNSKLSLLLGGSDYKKMNLSHPTPYLTFLC